MSTLNDFGIPGVNLSGNLEPKRKNRWRVTFANMGGGVDSQPVTVQAVTVTRPKLSFEEISIHRYNTTAYAAAKHTWEPLNLVIEDDVTSTASRVIQAQLQAQQWIIGAEGQFLATAGEASQYKFALNLDQLDGNAQVIERWVVEGCWLREVDWGDLDYSTGDQVQIPLVIRFDHARQSLGGYDQGQGMLTGGHGTA